MKYSIRISDGSYLSHKGKTAWCRRTAKKYATEWNRQYPETPATLEKHKEKVTYVYELTHVVSGRIRKFNAASWSEVEAQLIELGLDPDLWAILSVKEVE